MIKIPLPHEKGRQKTMIVKIQIEPGYVRKEEGLRIFQNLGGEDD